MPKKGLFYLLIFLVIGCALGFIAGNILFKKPVKPESVSQPKTEVPPAAVVEEKVSSAAVEVPAVPAAEENVPAPTVETPATVKEEAPVSIGTGAAEKEKIAKFEFQKGMTYIAWTEGGYSNSNSIAAIEQMVSFGIEWVALSVTQYQDEYNSTKIYPIRDKTPADESLIFAIRKLHELKLKVMLKPHLDIVNANGKWRGDIGFENPDDWQAWFKSYADFILRYANIASLENVELFCIGTELSKATLAQPQAWRDLIGKVREVYKGQLTYAANWSNEFDQITFWDALDYAGIDPYFPLVCSARPQVAELKSAWGDWIKQIEAWQAKINKPVIFTEIGYRSLRGANEEPWQHSTAGELDPELQTNCYQALLESFWERPWFYGVYWWYWGTNPKMGGALNRGFTPQNKPAQEIVKEWYSRPISTKSY